MGSKNKLEAILIVVLLVSGCAGYQSADVTPDPIKQDVLRCSGSSNPDFKKMSAENYRIYTACIEEFERRR